MLESETTIKATALAHALRALQNRRAINSSLKSNSFSQLLDTIAARNQF